MSDECMDIQQETECCPHIRQASRWVARHLRSIWISVQMSDESLDTVHVRPASELVSGCPVSLFTGVQMSDECLNTVWASGDYLCVCGLSVHSCQTVAYQSI